MVSARIFTVSDCFRIFLSAAIPLILGMLRSRRTRSGFVSSTDRIASMPSAASATTSKLGSDDNMALRPSRTRVSSSAINTRHFSSFLASKMLLLL
jgi:hypothetical protein